MGKMSRVKPRELCFSHEGKGVFMGGMTTTQMKALFDDRFIFKKMFDLYDCASFEELARYLTRRTTIYGEENIPEEIVEDMISEEVEPLSARLQTEVTEIWRLCYTRYRWKSFEKKFTTVQDIYDQYTDQTEDSYEWYTKEHRHTSQVLPIYQGEFFNMYETYVSYTWYNDTYVTKFAVIVPTIENLKSEKSE